MQGRSANARAKPVPFRTKSFQRLNAARQKDETHTHLPLPAAASVRGVVRLCQDPHRASLGLHLPRPGSNLLLRRGSSRVGGVEHHPASRACDSPEPAPQVPGRHAHIRCPAAEDPGRSAPAAGTSRRRTQQQRPQEATDAYHLMVMAPLAFPSHAALPEARSTGLMASDLGKGRAGRRKRREGGGTSWPVPDSPAPCLLSVRKGTGFQGFLVPVFQVRILLMRFLHKPTPRIGKKRETVAYKIVACLCCI